MIKDIQVLIAEDDANVILKTQLETLPPMLADVLGRVQLNIASAQKAQAFKNSSLVSRMAIAKKKGMLKRLEKMGASKEVIKETEAMFDNMTAEEIRDF
jgi:hypothetical protein